MVEQERARNATTPRAEERREAQRLALIDAAERAVAAAGPSGLKARDLARAVGCALGAIYNLVADMDELLLLVGSRTIARLDHALSEAAPGPSPAGGPEATTALVSVALAYSAFARDNLHLWRTLFEHRLPADRAMPDWAVEERMQLFRHVVGPLARLTPGASEAERALASRTLFSAVHGVVGLGLEEMLVSTPRDALDRQLEMLVRAICRGLSA